MSAGGDLAASLPDGRSLIREHTDPATSELLADVVGVHRAEPVRDEPPAPPVLIVIGGTFPRAPDGDGAWLERHAERFQAEGSAIVAALRRSLPGGTLDRVLVELLSSRLSQLVVPMPGLGEARVPRGLLARAAERGGAAASGVEGFLTWRDLGRVLAELLTVDNASALDQEVVLRVDDGDDLHVGGLRSAGVDDGCGGDERPALVLDGDLGDGRSCWSGVAKDDVAAPGESTTSGSAAVPSGDRPLGCGDLVGFMDDELVGGDIDRFHEHLRACEACRARLVEGMQLGTRLSLLTPTRSESESTEPWSELRAFAGIYLNSIRMDLRVRACAVGAALAALDGGKLLDPELAGVLVSVGRSMRQEVDPGDLARELLNLLDALHLGGGDPRGVHAPLVESWAGHFPGVRVSGCRCGWVTSVDVADAESAEDEFVTHVGEAMSDDMVALHDDCEACEGIAVGALPAGESDTHDLSSCVVVDLPTPGLVCIPLGDEVFARKLASSLTGVRRFVSRPDLSYEVLKILLLRWLRGDPPIAMSELQAQTGLTHPTVGKRIRELEPDVERTPNRSVRLRAFPTRAWAELVALSLRVRQTVGFEDRSGRSGDLSALVVRIQRQRPPNVALGGVVGARHWQPEFDLVGIPRVDLELHAPLGNADLRFVSRIDPALVPARPEVAPVLAVHVVIRAASLFEGSERALPWADPVEILLDLYQLKLHKQADDFIRFWRKQR